MSTGAEPTNTRVLVGSARYLRTHLPYGRTPRSKRLLRSEVDNVVGAAAYRSNRVRARSGTQLGTGAR